MTDLYGEGCIAIAATLEEIALLQEDAELNLHVTEAFRPDLLEIMKEAGWSEDSTSSVVEWANSHQDAACAKLGEENQVKSSVQVDKITEDLEVSEQNEGILLDDNITKIRINKSTADGHYYKEFVLEDDIANIKNILSDAIGEEIQEEIEHTGGRTFGVVLYNSNDAVVVSSYSDTIVHVGKKYYSVSDSDWASKILEYYEMSEIVENELK